MARGSTVTSMLARTSSRIPTWEATKDGFSQEYHNGKGLGYASHDVSMGSVRNPQPIFLPSHAFAAPASMASRIMHPYHVL